MTRYEVLYKLIEETQEVIKVKTTNLASLKEELSQLELKKWTPPNGNFIVDRDGTVLELSNFEKETNGIDPEFGNVRPSLQKAKKLAKNQRVFNRISAYFGDTSFVIETKCNGDHSIVSLNFYDYSKNDLSTFKREVIQ